MVSERWGPGVFAWLAGSTVTSWLLQMALIPEHYLLTGSNSKLCIVHAVFWIIYFIPSFLRKDGQFLHSDLMASSRLSLGLNIGLGRGNICSRRFESIK